MQTSSYFSVQSNPVSQLLCIVLADAVVRASQVLGASQTWSYIDSRGAWMVLIFSLGPHFLGTGS